MIEKEILNYFKGDDLAATVYDNKYRDKSKGELTPKDMHLRMAKEFSRIEEKYKDEEWNLIQTVGMENLKRSLSEYGYKRTPLNEESIFKLFDKFKYIIPQGSVMQNLGSDILGSLSNCHVVGQPYDSYGGILLIDEKLAQLMKRRGGVGTDISTLRPIDTEVTGAAKTSTGALSFIHRFSNTTREVAQNGRRGALMISMDINHPDILEFIKVKRDLTQVTGANISVKLNDEFMKAVENNEDYYLRFPTNEPISSFNITPAMEYNKLYKGLKEGTYFKKIKAKEYWDEIIKSAHNVAEPGLLFWDRLLDYAPDSVYPQYKPITTNPCSEIAMQEGDACRLIAVNLYSFVKNPFTDKAEFDYKKFYEINYEAMRLSDDLNDLEAEKIDKILKKIETDPEPWEVKQREYDLWKKVKDTTLSSRRTGLGFTGLGDMLAALNLKYDSDEALEQVEKVMKVKFESELDCTIDLSVLRGPFKGWDRNLEYVDGENEGDPTTGRNSFYQFIIDNYYPQFFRMVKFGRRNVSWSTVAPTGSLSMLAGVTSGIEPLFMPYYTRRKKINPNEKGVRVDFVDENGDSWTEFKVLHPKFKEWHNIYLDGKDGIELHNQNDEQLETTFKKSPWYKSTANDIDWIKRVKMQALIQKYITHSISSTINLPNDVTEEEVSEIYFESWKQGIKGITVYRDGSRSGVLISNDKKEENKDKFNYTPSPKRPEIMEAVADNIQVAGEKFALFLGFLDNKTFELFGYKGSTKPGKGIIKKIKSGEYVFIGENSNRERILTEKMDTIQRIVTRLISGSLRHGRHPKYIIDDINKENAGIFDWITAMKKMLLKYSIKDEDITDKTCPSCGSDSLIYEEGCKVCKSCGWSACG